MERKTAIITDVRYRMSLALIRELKAAGFYIVAVECSEATPPLGFYSRYTDETCFLSEENYRNELYALCRIKASGNGEKPLLFTVGAKSLAMVSENSEMFSGVCGFCAAEPETLALLNDKERLHELAESLGIPVPKEYAAPFADVQYPCIVKPVCGEKFGMKAENRYRKVCSREELDAALKFYGENCPGDACVVQQFLSGRGFGCSVMADRGSVKSLICHERIREYPVSGGPSMCCRSVHNRVLEEYASKLVSAAGFSGIAMFEFKESDGQFYLLECNPRVWGSFPLVRASKSDFCLKWAELCLKNAGEEVSEAPQKDYKDVKMHYLLGDIRAGVSYLKSGRVGLGLGAFLDTLNPAVRGGLFEWSDLRPSVEYGKRAFR